ncbi:MAG: toll/interleukin-1 receptor domain-containing protein [Actinomycetota bacterium]
MTAQVFISYAHADDHSFDEEAIGWVTNFVGNLQNDLARRSGGSKISCWMDHRLEPQRHVDETLRRRILESRCILAFMSPRYLESEWCQKEMATFVELIGGGMANDRVFLVELLPHGSGLLAFGHPGHRGHQVLTNRLQQAGAHDPGLAGP